MQHVRWGILGAAGFARKHMGPGLHLARRGRLAALATRDPAKATPFVDMTPDLQVYDSYEALLADPGIDAVYIPLPNTLHVDWTLRALAAGKAVLCEKPLAMHAGDFDQMIAARDASGQLAAEAYMIVHHPQWHKTKALIDAGQIGTLQRIEACFTYDNSGDPGNIRNAAGTGGGALPDIGVYIFGAARYVTAREPDKILSTDITWENGVDVTSHVTARFGSAHYSGLVSMRMSPWQRMSFHGDRGVLTLTAPFNPGAFGEAQIHLHRPDDGNFHQDIWRFPTANHYVAQAEAFNAAVLDGSEFPCPLEFSRGTQKMIDQVFDFDRSHK